MAWLETLFWLLVAVPVWAFVGYPLLMIVRGAVAGEQPMPAASWRPTATVVIAARGESDRIVRRVENIIAEQEYPTDLLDVVVACNGVGDGTAAACRSAFGDDPRVKVLDVPDEEGKAGSLNRGVAAADGEVVVFADARQRFEPDVVRVLTARLADPEVGAVSGRLVVGRADDAAVKGVQSYWALETRLREAESRTGSVVGCTGAVYAIRRELYAPLPPTTVLDDVLTPMRIALDGHAVKFEAGAVARDVPSRTAGRELERKSRTLAGNLQILGLEPRLLSVRKNPLFFRYVSHRLLRVVGPWCLVAVMVLGLFLPTVPYTVVSGALGALFLLGLLGLLTGWAALAAPAGFLVVNAAALAALGRWLGARDHVWRRTS